MVITYFLLNRNIKKVDIGNVEKIYINYRYDGDLSDYPITTIELNEKEKENIINELKKWKFKKYDDGARGTNNYEVILNDNVKFTFQYDNLPNWFDGKSEFSGNWYNGTEIFETKLPVSVLLMVVQKVDKELLNRTKEFQTNKLIIKTKDTITTLESVYLEDILDETKHIIRAENIEVSEVKYTLDFNNGTILQIYKPETFSNTEDKKSSKIFGRAITNDDIITEVQIPHSMIYDIDKAIELFSNNSNN